MANIDEQAVKTRLLNDGDGGGDDRRLISLAKQVIKWSSTPWASDAPDAESAQKIEAEDGKHHASMLAQLLFIRWNDEKTKLVQTMTSNETENYEALYEHIKEEIESASVAIRESKEELKRAQKIRRNRLEYDALSKVIKEFPDRMTTAARLQEIEAELDKSRAEEEALDEKLLQRKKQFHLLIHTIHQLQGLLDQDEEEISVSENQSETVSEGGDSVSMDVN